MKKSITLAASYIGVLMVLLFESVVGLPLVSLVLFYYLSVKAHPVVQALSLLVFTLCLASLYPGSPVVLVCAVVFGHALLQWWKARTIRARGWSYVLVSLVVGVSVVASAGIVLHAGLLLSSVLQIVVVRLVIQHVVFKGVTQEFKWSDEVVSVAVYEKKI